MEYQIQTQGRIWLIGGTSESVELALAIARADLVCTISVTTEAARSLYPDLPQLQVWVGRLNPTEIGQFLATHNIVAVLDASHPYAVEISTLAIATCTQYQIPYLRYERPFLQKTQENTPKNSQVIRLDSFATLVAGDYLQQQRVLLTIGYKPLSLFQPWQRRSTLFARILPAVASLEAALAAGFTSDRIIAVRPPVSMDLERALWQQWDISLVVTKASGTAGGEDIKQAIAAELDVTLIAIDRPWVDYPQQTSELSVAIAFCRAAMGHGAWGMGDRAWGIGHGAWED